MVNPTSHLSGEENSTFSLYLLHFSVKVSWVLTGGLTWFLRVSFSQKHFSCFFLSSTWVTLRPPVFYISTDTGVVPICTKQRCCWIYSLDCEHRWEITCIGCICLVWESTWKLHTRMNLPIGPSIFSKLQTRR